MSTYVVDIETDGLKSTKIHVMSYGVKDKKGEWRIRSTNNYEEMKDLLEDPDNIIIGHNFKDFDAVELERVLGFTIKAEVIDTLAISWYIMPNRSGSYGLESFGTDYGIKKPKIDDWEGLSYNEYKNRCEEDVKINIALWEDLSRRLIDLYGTKGDAIRVVRYLMFKMDCIVHQKMIGTLIDLDKVKEHISILEELKKPKEDSLIDAMPKTVVLKSMPKNIFKKNGELSVAGSDWYKLLNEKGLPIDTEVIYDDPNPNSVHQVKDWLFSIGWKPTTYKDGSNGKVPQVRDDNRELCSSVLKLIEEHPDVEALDGLTVISHRLGVLNSILSTTDLETGYTVAGMNGFTNTLRLRHKKPIANLPKVTGGIYKALENGVSLKDAIADNLRDGYIIRSCIIAPGGYELCGSDITSLEDNTKRHYMWDYDPEYVKDQMVEGYDPHLDLALRAGAVTEEDVELHKLYSETDAKEGKSLKKIRDIYKQANYSCIYGVGAPKLSHATGLTIREAKELINAYWDRNWSIKQLPKDIKTKFSYDQLWLQNPVNKFWYSIREEKDIFSTLNQGTGSFVFDCWLKYMIQDGVIPFLQYHDEKLSLVKKGQRGKHEKIIRESMVKVNDILKLNIEITVDVQFGNCYADVH